MTQTDARSRIRIGSAPDSWGVWFPDDPEQVPWQRFLDEVSACGYEWIELGPYGYLPTDPARLADELAAFEETVLQVVLDNNRKITEQLLSAGIVTTAQLPHD